MAANLFSNISLFFNLAAAAGRSYFTPPTTVQAARPRGFNLGLHLPVAACQSMEAHKFEAVERTLIALPMTVGCHRQVSLSKASGRLEIVGIIKRYRVAYPRAHFIKYCCHCRYCYEPCRASVTASEGPLLFGQPTNPFQCSYERPS